jgi:signal transduction histidine kinase/CheY-like chemotaxis protein
MSQNSPSLDYLAPDISALESQRRQLDRGLAATARPRQSQMTRELAIRMLPACVAAPALVWLGLGYGVHRNWYSLETCSILFVCSITIVFGLVVCLNLWKLSHMDAHRSLVEDQLKLAKEAAEAANRFRSAFFANISHEIRTPLTAINGFAELAMNPQRDEQERLADARVIRRNGEHLLTLINDILDLSKIEAGKMSVDPILCRPAQIVGDVCAMLRPRATEKGLTLEVRYEGSIPKMIRTDPTRMRQILINLIANAVKFTKEGGVQVTVAIKPSIGGQNPLLEVKIADTGIGIPAEQLGSLFQAFVQGDANITRQYGGSGLGLAISRHFARVLEGDITVTSTPGRGSTFTVTVGTGSLVDVAVDDRPEQALDGGTNFAGPSVRISGSVLVAEDGIDNQALVATRLRDTGLSVQIAPNGQVAVEKALAALRQDKPFDLILMDVQMPVMDGFSATLCLRNKGYTGPIIALTANAMERDRNKCLQAGCNDFVTKPIDMEKLIKAMGRYMTVTAAPAKSPANAATAAASAAARVQSFYKDLPEELEQIEKAIERQDREQVRETAQLILGKAVAAGLIELAPGAAKLLHGAQSDSPWLALRQELAQFARDAQEDRPREVAA